MAIDFIPVSLPSKCKCYPGVNPDDVKIRTLRGKDEELLAELNPENSSKNLLMILGNVIQGIDVKKLTSQDAMWILLWEAINSFDNMLDLRVTCNNCFEQSIVGIDLQKISADEISDSYVYPYTVETALGVFKLRPQTISDENVMIEWEKKNKPQHLLRYALRMIDDITNMSLETKIHILEEMDVKDLQKIKQEDEYSYHGTDMKASYVCPVCKSEGNVILPFRFKELFRISRPDRIDTKKEV